MTTTRDWNYARERHHQVNMRLTDRELALLKRCEKGTGESRTDTILAALELLAAKQAKQR